MATKQTQALYKKLFQTLNTGATISESLILRFSHALSRNDNALYSIISDNLSAPYLVSATQASKGAKYLIKKYLCKNGNGRKISALLDDDFLSLIKALYNGEKYYFTFDGYERITNGFFSYFAPVYTLCINGLKYSYFHYNGLEYSANTSAIKNGNCQYLQVYNF